MPPNPRDHLGANDPVPLDRVEEVIADALRSALPPSIVHRPLIDSAAARIIDRLGYFKLLAPDVEGASFGFVPHQVVVPAEYVPAGASMVTPTPPTCAPVDDDPIPRLGYCRCVQCCCKEGQGHKSAEYRSWEARQQR
jgi:hypothetical protein